MKTKLLRKAKKAVKLYRGHKGDFFISVQGVPMYAVIRPEEAQTLYRMAVCAAAKNIYRDIRGVRYTFTRRSKQLR